MAEVGFREYARRRGVSLAAVQKAIASGRLKNSLHVRGKRTLIDVEHADREWDANTNASQVRDPKETRKKTGELFPEASSAPPRTQAELIEEQNERNTLRRAMALRQAMLAQSAKLEYEERSGRLCTVEDARKETTRLFIEVRDEILNVPERIAARAAAETDEKKVRLLFRRELEKALERLARGTERS